MKLFVKQDGGFRYLGEGTIYNKSDLTLVNEITGAITNAKNVAQAQKEAQQTMNQNPNVNSVETDAGHLDGQNDTGGGEGQTLQLPINASATEISNAQRLANQANNDDMNIQFVDTGKTFNNPSMGESKHLSKRLVEMRKNAVPFTKAELNRWLKEN